MPMAGLRAYSGASQYDRHCLLSQLLYIELYIQIPNTLHVTYSQQGPMVSAI